MELLYQVPKRKVTDWTAAPYHDERWHELQYPTKQAVFHAITKAARVTQEGLITYEPKEITVNWNANVGEVVWLNAPMSVVDPKVETEFRKHAEKWSNETAHISSATELVLHPSYQRIIGLGPAVLPLILKDLAQEPKDWFWALKAITGGSPVAPEHAGNMRKMTDAWIKWGREHGYI